MKKVSIAGLRARQQRAAKKVAAMVEMSAAKRLLRSAAEIVAPMKPARWSRPPMR